LGTAASGGTERVNAITAYDMPGFTNRKLVNSANLGTTDLATCSSPPTITIEKDVVSRVNTGDQFKLNLNSGSTTLATATTTGSANGVQK
ncbi:hypothetical protein KC219_23270, partial [Mycobacterium tuberculosis]|nr:hypothetical protein [Mycobacterium tuberculosis]